MKITADRSLAETAGVAAKPAAQRITVLDDGRPATESEKKLQALANGSRRVRYTAQLQGLVDRGTRAGAPPIQRQKKDAEEYAAANKLPYEKLSKQDVETYVNDVKNAKDLRKGLLEAWNKDQSERWTVAEPADLQGGDNPFSYQNFDAYKNWTTASQGVSVTTPFGGDVSAFHNRGAPKVGSKAEDWGKSQLGDSYKEYIRGLRSGGLTDAEIAEALLQTDSAPLLSWLEKRAAAMLHVTVYLSEEWRKQGAAKIYRAMLRTIAKGVHDFDDFLRDFDFITSADQGRKMVARFYDVWLKIDDKSTLPGHEADYYDEMSEAQQEDFSSDDDMRTDDKKNLKGKRLYADKHQ